MNSLQELVKRAQSGDRRAFDKVVDRFQSRVRRLIRRQLDGKLEQKVGVEDLMQETFLEAWRGIQGFLWQGEEAFAAWLTTLSRRVVAGHVRRLRSKKRDMQRERPLNQKVRSRGGTLRELVDLVKASGTSASKMLRRDERLERLKDAIQALNPEYRKVILLTRVKGLPVKEVAQLMSRSPGAVSMLLLRALETLRSSLSPTDSIHLPEGGLEEDDFGL